MNNNEPGYDPAFHRGFADANRPVARYTLPTMKPLQFVVAALLLPASLSAQPREHLTKRFGRFVLVGTEPPMSRLRCADGPHE